MTELTDERLLSMAAEALGYASIDLERGAEEGPGSFRQALEVFPEELIAFARAALAAEPAFAASEPSDEDLADLSEVFNGDPLPAMRRAFELWGRPTIAALAAEPPAPAPSADGAARLRQCPTHGQQPANAWACPECLRELREELARLKAPAADGEREELAQWFDEEAKRCAAQFHDRITRAAALLRQPAPAPVPVAERPWERPGWCDVEGRCWWFNRAGIPEWQLADGGPYGDFCLPHWAIPQPPQGGEVT